MVFNYVYGNTNSPIKLRNIKIAYLKFDLALNKHLKTCIFRRKCNNIATVGLIKLFLIYQYVSLQAANNLFYKPECLPDINSEILRVDRFLCPILYSRIFFYLA